VTCSVTGICDVINPLSKSTAEYTFRVDIPVSIGTKSVTDAYDIIL